jgi:hypothetical protein
MFPDRRKGMKPEDIARVCHEANKAYCESIGDMSQPHWEDAPAWQKESAIAGVKAFVDSPNKNNDKIYEESHNGWLEMRLRDGWTYGDVKDPERKVHPCMLPYHSLPNEQKWKDRIFTSICRALI